MRPSVPAEAFEHGDPRRYRRGCRCIRCLNGINAETRRNAYLRATGRGAITTPQRAAGHIAALREAGMSDVDICAAANIVSDVLYRIAGGRSDIRRSTEARILAVSPSPTGRSACGAHIPALGAVRRLRALAADGWPAAELARRAGRCKQFIVYLQNLDLATSPRARMWVASYIRTLYGDTAGLAPEDHGVPIGFARAGRARAAAKNWVGTSYWDDEDFDDPDFEPATEATPRYVEIGENGLELLAQGYARRDAAERLGVTTSVLETNIRRYREALGEAA